VDVILSKSAEVWMRATRLKRRERLVGGSERREGLVCLVERLEL
jgi:hypothetical protein